MKISKADNYFSLFIRVRDAFQERYGYCITCNTFKDVKEMDCGHYIKRQHQSTRFNEMNCQTQCKRCNNFEQGANEIFRRKLVEKYGEEKVLMLEQEGRKTVKRGKFELEQIAKYYKSECEILAKEKGIELW